MHKNNKANIWVYILPNLFIVLSWLIYLYVITQKLTCWEQRSGFGDMFGALSALFTGFAFAGVIITVYLQREELALQREELFTTREEFKAQTKTFNKQLFETSFYQLLNYQNNIVKEMDLRTVVVNSNAIGRICFRELYDIFKREYCETVRDMKDQEEINNAIHAYEKFYDNNQPFVAHYFTNLYIMLKYIDNAEFIGSEDQVYKEKKYYTNIIRAQLSTYELLLLGYHSLSTINLRYNGILNKYNILKFLPANRLLKPEHETVIKNILEFTANDEEWSKISGKSKGG
ncbi:putative phage abortive infection protein [candidate division TA06 bacterium]|nr:putative phage abortive infection protein [candidate division TA06 bacterium]